MRYHLAIDIGASGGRHILGHLEEGRLITEEIYRFENAMTWQDGSRVWDLPRLFREILAGMRCCREQEKIPSSVAIDTWAVDYVLLDKNRQVLGKTYGYRDARTEGMDAVVEQYVPAHELYRRTGIQKQPFNTIYQLMAVKQQEPQLLEQAETFLMLPDYFNFLLTGRIASEYTNATSTQLVNPQTRDWDRDLIHRLGYPERIFQPLCQPGTSVGELQPSVCEAIGYDCRVLQCASHDTASAVMAAPLDSEGGLYISSGTWSLMGAELAAPLCTEESERDNFTNEGGYAGRFRYLKNIMGLWMIQEARREWGAEDSYAELCHLAAECDGFPSRVDANAAAFLAPDSMLEAIRTECRRQDMPEPQTKGEMAAVIYRSLAACYGQTARQIENNTGRRFRRIYIIGGGARADYLNRLTAQAAERTVVAGPAEATAIGNLLAQLIAYGELGSLEEGRRCVAASFELKSYEPNIDKK